LDVILIEGLLPAVPRCANDTAPYPGYAARVPVALWLADVAGTSAAVLRQSAEPGDRRLAATVRRRPQAEQLGWYRANVRAMSECGVKPRRLTSR
jgi:hypothetical protein